MNVDCRKCDWFYPDEDNWCSKYEYKNRRPELLHLCESYIEKEEVSYEDDK